MNDVKLEPLAYQERVVLADMLGNDMELVL